MKAPWGTTIINDRHILHSQQKSRTCSEMLQSCMRASTFIWLLLLAAGFAVFWMQATSTSLLLSTVSYRYIAFQHLHARSFMLCMNASMLALQGIINDTDSSVPANGARSVPVTLILDATPGITVRMHLT